MKDCPYFNVKNAWFASHDHISQAVPPELLGFFAFMGIKI